MANDAVLAFAVHFNYDLALHLKASKRELKYGNPDRVEVLKAPRVQRPPAQHATPTISSKPTKQDPGRAGIVSQARWSEYMQTLRNSGTHRFVNPARFQSPLLSAMEPAGSMPVFSLSGGGEARNPRSALTQTDPDILDALLVSKNLDTSSVAFGFRHSFRVGLRGMQRLGYTSGLHVEHENPRRSSDPTQLERDTVMLFGARPRPRGALYSAAQPVFVHRGNLPQAQQLVGSSSIIEAARPVIQRNAANN